MQPKKKNEEKRDREAERNSKTERESIREKSLDKEERKENAMKVVSCRAFTGFSDLLVIF